MLQFDHFVSLYIIVPVGLLEAVAVGWGYGADRLAAHILHFTGR